MKKVFVLSLAEYGMLDSNLALICHHVNMLKSEPNHVNMLKSKPNEGEPTLEMRLSAIRILASEARGTLCVRGDVSGE